MTEPIAPKEIGIVDYGKILWTRRLTIVLTVVFAVAAVISLDVVRTKKYSATASIIFVSQSYASSGSAVELSPQDIATQIRLVSSASVKVQVARSLHAIPPDPSATQVGTTTVANVTVTSTDPRFAARAANAYVAAYISQSEQTYLAQQQVAEANIQYQINSLQTQIDSTQQDLAKASAANSPPLTAQLGTLDAQQQALRTQLTQIQINAAQAPSGGRLVSPAVVPSSPSSPKPVTDTTLAIVLGLIVGVAIALLRDFLDNRIKSQSDLELAAGGLPILGLIPKISEWHNKKNTVLVSVARPTSPAAEAYRGLRTSIQFASLEKANTIIEVTSASAGDGKTTTAANLAVSMAEAGNRVVLVSCDLRKPRLHEFFSLPNQIGFTSVLVDQSTLPSACVPVPGVERLWLLPSGPTPPNPSELLGGQRGRELFRVLGEQFDVVIIDTPPILPVTDAVVVATIADAVVVVCGAKNTTSNDFSKGLQLLSRVDAPILGVVLNSASTSDAYVYYRYGETYGTYGAAPEAPPRTTTKSSRGKRTSGSRGQPAVVVDAQTRNGVNPVPSASSPEGPPSPV